MYTIVNDIGWRCIIGALLDYINPWRKPVRSMHHALIRIYAQPMKGSPAVFEQRVEQATAEDIKAAVAAACDSLDFVPARVLVTKTEVQP